jgi:opacity protein-like surface antigen
MTMKLFAAVALAVLIAVPAYAADVSTEIKEQNEKLIKLTPSTTSMP